MFDGEVASEGEVPPPCGIPDGLTRGQFLRAAGAGAGLLYFAGSARAASRATGSATRAASKPFRSRPDLLPPHVSVSGTPAPAGEGYSFLAPTNGGTTGQVGPLILDANGSPVWFRPVGGGQWAMNFRVQTYRGAPVLTWWQGKIIPPGYGQGVGVIVDGNYRPIATVRAGNGRQIDLHEFLLTPEGTALVTCYPKLTRADLRSVGGPRNGQALESVIQEIDVASGHVLFEWRSLEHVHVGESFQHPGGAYDYLHANSIDITPDGHLLVSARHTWTIYKVHRRTGRVMWRLGGKHSSFALGRPARFSWQHDARQVGPNAITVFDDGAGAGQRTETQSRGLVLQHDVRHRRFWLQRAYHSPKPLLAGAMGNMQTLPDGNVIIGWGSVPALSEFSPAGQQLSALWLPWGHQSYRGFRLPWTGTPTTAPVTAITSDPTNGVVLYASWNGATEVANWQVLVGPSAAALQPLKIAPRTGFETTIPLGTVAGYAGVAALDAAGRTLGTSRPAAIPA